MRMPVSVPPPSSSTRKGQNSDIVGAIQVGKESGMPWYFDKQQLRDTPSIRDGISFETERRYRREGARFIMSCGTEMSLGHNTMATGVVYFHRFYMFHSFKSFPRYVTACCCLLLAGKVEETPKKCRDVIRTARTLLADNHFYSFGDDPKEEVMTLERILLQTIKFDLQVEHPYTFLLKYAKCFKGDQQKLQKMVQMAWNFVNDSLSTVVCLQWEPEIIAVALIHLASKLSKFTLLDWTGRQPHHTRWWDMFVSEVTMEILEDICHQVLDLYQNNQKDSNGPPSPPQVPPSRADLPKPTTAQSKVRSNSGNSGLSPVRKSSKSNHNNNIANVAISSLNTLVPPTHISAPGGNVIASHHHGLNNTTNHIQPIRSLAAAAAPIPTTLDGASATSSAAIPTNYQSLPHHMYRAPPPANSVGGHVQQIHSMYAGSVPAPPPPPPPLPTSHGYGAVNSVSASHPPPPPPYQPNVWPAVMPPSSHYPSNIPPMPPPNSAPHPHVPPPPPSHGGSGSNYYHHPSAHHSRHQQHHPQHYGRQQRY